jgi:hypothetical protein
MSNSSKLQDVLNRVKGARPQGKGWIAVCPVHDDRNPSLSIIEENGRILLHCHAGCTTASVVVSMGLEWTDLFQERSVRPNTGRSATKSCAEAQYNYVDEGGQLLYQVLRFDPKTFRQRRPKGSGWTWDLEGVRRVLYRLPDVLKSDSILVCEGEKDCDSAFKMGLIATCNPGGAGKWKDEYACFLRGKSVVIIQDADVPGRLHAETIATSLQANVKSLKVLELPTAKDLTEWIDAGGSQEGLKELISKTPIWISTRFEGQPVLNACKAYVKRFVRLTDSQVTVIALWIAHTFAFEAADATPYLQISSPVKRSGKTRLLEVLETVVSNPWMTGRVTTAVLPRKIDLEHPTLLLDESDSAFSGDPGYAATLRGILNNGHRRGGKVSCCSGQGAAIIARDYSVFCPKAIAGIGSLPDTVADRSVPIYLKRKASSEFVERFRLRDIQIGAASLCDQFGLWLGSIVEALRKARPNLPEQLTDRQQDGAEPLLAIADAAGGDWPQSARLALIELCCEAQSKDASLGARILGDIKQIFEQKRANRISSADLVISLAEIETGPWADYSNGKSLTAAKLARLLGPFSVVPHSIRIGDRTPKGYQIEDFQDAWKRYVPEQDLSMVVETSSINATTQQDNIGAPTEQFLSRNVDTCVAAHKLENCNGIAGCCTVAPSPGSAEPIKHGIEEEHEREQSLRTSRSGWDCVSPRRSENPHLVSGPEVSQRIGSSSLISPLERTQPITVPRGVSLIQWDLKDPPVAIEECAVVTDTGLFARTTLNQLGIALAGPRRWVGWTVSQLIDRLQQVGVTVVLDAPT